MELSKPKIGRPRKLGNLEARETGNPTTSQPLSLANAHIPSNTTQGLHIVRTIDTETEPVICQTPLANPKSRGHKRSSNTMDKKRRKIGWPRKVRSLKAPVTNNPTISQPPTSPKFDIPSNTAQGLDIDPTVDTGTTPNICQTPLANLISRRQKSSSDTMDNIRRKRGRPSRTASVDETVSPATMSELVITKKNRDIHGSQN